MSLFHNRGGDHEQEQQTQQKRQEGFLSRLLKGKQRKDKKNPEDEEDRRPSLRTTYRQKQSENLWGATRRSSCSSRVFRDIKRIHRRLSGSSRKILHSSGELFASLGMSEGSLDPDQIHAIADDEIGGGQGTSTAKAAKDIPGEQKGMLRRRSTTRTKTKSDTCKKESAQEDTCGDSDLDNSAAPEDGFYGWPSMKRLSIDSNA